MLLKGELEKLGTPKGLPNPVKLFNTILDQSGRSFYANWRWKPRTSKARRPARQAHRDRVRALVLMQAEGATMTLSF